MPKTTNYKVKTELTAKDSASTKFGRMALQAGRAHKQFKKVARSIKNVSTAAGRATKKAAGFGTLFGGAVAVGITAINKQTREMDALALATGQNVDVMKALGERAKILGLGYDNVVDLAEELNNKFGESTGLEEITAVTESLDIMGLKFKDIKKLAPDKQFEAVSKALLNMPNAQQASSAADILFGGEASKFFGFLRRNGENLDGIINRYQRLNFLNKDGRKGALAFGKSFDKISIQARSLAAQFSGVLGQALTPVINSLSSYLSMNKEFIQDKIAGWAEDIAKHLKEIDVDRLTKFAENFSKSFEAIAGFVESISSGINSIKSLNDKVKAQQAEKREKFQGIAEKVRKLFGVPTNKTGSPETSGFVPVSDIRKFGPTVKQAERPIRPVGPPIREPMAGQAQQVSIQEVGAMITQQLSEILKGILEVKVKVEGEGVKVLQTGITNKSPVVGNVGSSLPEVHF